MFRLFPRRVVLTIGLLLAAVLARAEMVGIASNGLPSKKIVIPVNSGTALQAAAEELRGFLNRMKSGTSSFVVEKFDPAAGPGANTIVLGRAGDLNLAAQLDDPSLPEPKEREHYLIASANSTSNIVIAGTTDLAVSHGVYDFLERLGCGWFMPTSAWEVVPPANPLLRWTTPAAYLSSPVVVMGTKLLAMKVYHDEMPAFKSRAFTRTFYTEQGGSPDQEWQQQWDEAVLWDKRNRGAQPLRINCAPNYANIVEWAKSQTTHPEANPPVTRWKQEYYAQVSVNGVLQRGCPGNPAVEKQYQICAANPEVVRLCQDYARAWFAAHPGEDSISMQPNDGVAYWCECSGCKFLKWGDGAGDGTANDDTFLTDRVVRLANAVAEVIPAGKYVGIMASARHAGWPSFPVRPNVSVEIVHGYLSGGMTWPMLLQKWAEKWPAGSAPNIGVHDYFSLFAEDRGLPNGACGSDLKSLKNSFFSWHEGAAGADQYEARSSYTLGLLGLSQYVAMKLLWDVRADIDTIRKDFLTKCFGAETTPLHGIMNEFFRRVDGGEGHALSTDLLGRLYGLLDKAYAACSPATDAKVIERLDALAVWVRYCELRLAYETKDFGARQADAEAILRFVWKIRATSMVDSLAAWRSISIWGNNANPDHDEFQWPLNTQTWTVSESSKAKTSPGSGNFVPTSHSVIKPPGTYELAWHVAMNAARSGKPEPHPWKEPTTYSHAEIVSMVAAGVANSPLLAEEPRNYSHDMIFAGMPAAVPRGTLSALRLRKIGLYLRSNASGSLPVLRMTTGHSENKGDIPFALSANDGITELQTGSLTYGTSSTSTVTFLDEMPDTDYIFSLQDFAAGTKVGWDPGEKVSMMARPDYPYSAYGAARRYFFVPKGTKTILAYASSIGTCDFRRLAESGSSRYVQRAASGGVPMSIPITEAEDDQIWFIENLYGQDFFFQNIPGVLAASPDELLLPREAFGELQSFEKSSAEPRGSFQKMSGRNVFYLRKNERGELPALTISTGWSGSQGAAAQWKLLSESGAPVPGGTGFIPPNRVPYPIAFPPTGADDTFLLMYDDNANGSNITWEAGAKISMAANPGSPHSQTGGVTRRYFFVPKGTKLVEYQAKSMLGCDVYTIRGVKKHRQESSVEPVVAQIPVSPGEDGQIWYFSSSFGASEFFFTSIPGYLAARPDELLVPRWTRMNP